MSRNICSKFCLVFLNVPLFLLGIGALIVGSLYLQYNRKVAIGVVVVAIIIISVGLFGICGALMESKIFLNIYIIVMILLTLALIGGLVALIVYKKRVTNTYLNITSNRVKQFSTITDEVDKSTIIAIFKQRKCCGFEEVNDYPLLFEKFEECRKTPIDGKWTLTCIEKVKNESNVIYMAILVLTALLLLCTIFASTSACCITCQDRHYRDKDSAYS
ncbi:unnamed protein product [Didymodactylos carnosus]|uniref:Tetraspanin n=1 Tax=Didymodactylos carnosus TaxID=1234261 RepID=A0A813SA07_9BILA|nr:unnamed protein product [Didymodactylos carnosus]CAF3577815.1 unnamed protein product [Didymodactylos carnosus]